MDSQLNWNDLRFFLAVARGGSLSSAARSLGVTQPTVGRRVDALEQSLESTLFLRVPQGLSLTEHGRELLVWAQRIELEALAAERSLTGSDAGAEGSVTVTVPGWFASQVLAPILPEFFRLFPNIEVHVNASRQKLSLVRRDAQIAVRLGTFEDLDVVQWRLPEVDFAVYASQAYLWKHGAPDFDNGCEGHALVLLEESIAMTPSSDWWSRVASRARVVARCNGRELQASLVKAGVGIACLPKPLGDSAPRLEELPLDEVPQRQLWMGVHRDSAQVPRVSALASYISQTLSTTLWPKVDNDQGACPAPCVPDPHERLVLDGC